MSASPTELTAILVNSGMPPVEASKCSVACADASIGITTIVSVLGYEGSGLATPGSAEFTTTMGKLQADVIAVDATALATAALKGQFTTAIRKCAKEGNEQEASQMKAIGLGATPGSGTLVLGMEGEPILKSDEINKRRQFEAAIGGHWHHTDATPSVKMISFFAKGFAEEPPVLRNFPLGNACSDFNARQSRKPSSALEKMAGREDDQFDQRAEKPGSKGKFIHSIVLVGNAITIAASTLIPTADQGKYIELEAGRVQFNGAKEYAYGTRHITEVLLMTTLIEGAKSDPDQLNAGYEALMKSAGRYVTARYMVNAAFTKAAHEEKAEWRPTRAPPLNPDPKRGRPGGREPTDKTKALDAVKAEAKKACGKFNRAEGCTVQQCRFTHACSAIVQKDGKFAVCGDRSHNRTQHLEMAKAGSAPAVLG